MTRKAALPGTTIFTAGKVFIQKNWSDKHAYITIEDDDVHKICQAIFHKGQAHMQTPTKSFVKHAPCNGKTKDSVNSLATSSQNPSGCGGRSSSNECGSRSNKCALRRNVIDLGVPEELKAPPKRSKARAS